MLKDPGYIVLYDETNSFLRFQWLKFLQRWLNLTIEHWIFVGLNFRDDALSSEYLDLLTFLLFNYDDDDTILK